MFIPVGDNIYKRTIPIVPLILILANVFIFWLELKSADPRTFVKTWGLVPSVLAKGKLIGLITHMFLHGSVAHLVGNMIVLWTFSVSLEISLGRWMMLAAYLIFGVTGGIVQAVMDWSSSVPIIGASGAVAGVMGAYVVLFGWTSKIHGILFLWLTPVRLTIPSWLVCGLWFAIQWYWAEWDPACKLGVAWYVHIGGFLAGVGLMSICRYDTDCDVRKSRYGHLALSSGKKCAVPEPGHGGRSPESHSMANLCPYCQCELSEENRIAPNMARCGKYECLRLICLTPTGDMSTISAVP
jgi:membrane associated rhomboid family serine protease